MSAGTKPEEEGAAGGRDDAQSQFASYAQPMVSEALARAASLDPDPENLHKLRVALRRLRTLLWAWRPLLGCAFVEPRRALLKRAAAAAAPPEDTEAEEAGPQVVHVNHHERRKPMTVDEAMLEIDNRDYVVYRDAATGRVSVLIKRPDGNCDLIEA